VENVTETYPIVCIEQSNARLFAEVIQIVETRQIGWLRPLGLEVLASGVVNELGVSELGSGEPELPTIFYDLRQTADLLWPLSLFRPALDTEILPVLSALQSGKPLGVESGELAIASRHQLQQFIQDIWQSHRALFDAPSKLLW
jgi:hypothetical protein